VIFTLKDKLKPTLEALKELGRLALLFVVSWIITETLKQLGVVPEKATITIWLFNYTIPIRLLVNLGLTALGRYVDKLLHEIGKAKEKLGETSKLTGGLTRF
jgi:hypothetical protein